MASGAVPFACSSTECRFPSQKYELCLGWTVNFEAQLHVFLVEGSLSRGRGSISDLKETVRDVSCFTLAL